MLEKAFRCLSNYTIIDCISSIRPLFFPIILMPVLHFVFDSYILPLVFDSFYNKYDPNFAVEISKLKLELLELDGLDELMSDMANEGHVVLRNEAILVLEGNATNLNFNRHVEIPRNQINLLDGDKLEIDKKIKSLEKNKNDVYFIFRVAGVCMISVGCIAVSFIIGNPRLQEFSC